MRSVPLYRQALAAKDYALILGMPGTGKSTLIVYLVMCSRLSCHIQYWQLLVIEEACGSGR